MRKKGSAFIAMGLLLIAAALLLTGYNIWDSYRAGEASREVALMLVDEIPNYPRQYSDRPAPTESTEPLFPDIPDREMPTAVINGYRYIGILDIDSLGLSLPIMEDWDYNRLDIAPCRFTGNVYQNNMVICGHNYTTHFMYLKNLPLGTEIRFTDMDGNVFLYSVVSIETVAPTAVEQMTTGDWSLTLFTCNTGGQTRCAIRCDRIA